MNSYYQVNLHGPVSQHRVWNGVESNDSVHSVVRDEGLMSETQSHFFSFSSSASHESRLLVTLQLVI